jgi:hypothetical protein
MVHSNIFSLFALALVAAAAVTAAASLPSAAEYLTGLPAPSTNPFGIRLSFADTSSSYTVTWSTTAPLTRPPCVLLFPPTTLTPKSTLAVGSTQKKTNQQHGDISSLPYYSRRNLETSSLLVEADKNQQQQRLKSTVFENESSPPLFICGSSTPFIEPETQVAAHFIHTVRLDNLESSEPSATYQYKCGNDIDGWSQLYSFYPPPPPGSGSSGAGGPTNFLLLGDMGVAHALTLPYLLKDVTTKFENAEESESQSSPPFSAVLHVGDLGYDLNHYQGRKAQHFLRMIEPLSASLPYMVAPGNHEAAFNFSHYRSLFKMPQWETSQNLYYSFDMGLVHIVVYNTEVFFWPESYGIENMKLMYEWLEDDLKKANENRNQVPWVIALGHRPMYCSSVPNYNSSTTSTGSTGNSTVSSTINSTMPPWCGFEAEASRRGIPSTCPHNNPRACHRSSRKPSHTPGAENENNINSPPTKTTTFPIEELFKKYNVDIFVAGHIHDYERYWPVYNYTYTSYPTQKETPSSNVEKKTTSLVENSQKELPTVTTATVTPSFYYNPNATVHIISGAGGNSEMRIGPGLPPQGPCSADTPWCAFQSGHGPLVTEGYDFSYSRVFVHNASHLQWQQYSVTFDRVIDEFWILQQR